MAEVSKSLKNKAEQAISDKVFPGCVIGIVRKNGEREVMPFGNFTYEVSSPGVREDTIYDMASVTKSIPLASLALMFVEEGKMRLDDPVKKYIPELQNDYGATVEDLLRYRVQGARLSKFGYSTFEQIRTHVLEHGFDGPPGEGKYTNLPAYILGIVVERVGGSILPALADKYFFKPLNMSDTTFFPHDLERIAPTEIVDGKEIRGIMHDESARVFARARRAVGHAGLFSTAPDMFSFLGSLLSGKFPAIIAGAEKGLGWELSQPWFIGERCGPKTFGKTGFTGTSVIVDAERGMGLVILSNRTYPQRPPDAASLTSAIYIFRKEIANIVFGAA